MARVRYVDTLIKWQTSQIDEHCDRDRVKYFTYHGSLIKSIRSKCNYRQVLAKYTFVLATYDTVRGEYTIIEKRRQWESQRRQEDLKRQGIHCQNTSPQKANVRSGHDEVDSEDEKFLSDGKSFFQEDANSSLTKLYWTDLSVMPSNLSVETPLFEIPWRRIVLDEAHTARNPRTNLFRAICELQAERKWAVTGTPIVNSTRDLGSLAAWIGLDPFASSAKAWSELIERPLKKPGRYAERAAGLLRAVVQVSIARTNSSVILTILFCVL